MGQFIGTAGGFLMAVLVVVLFLRFLHDMGVCTICSGEAVMLISIAGIGLAELVVCGIYYTVTVPDTFILDLPVIWKDKYFWLSGIWPFNWYFSMLCGTAALWNWHQVIHSLFGEKAAKQGVYLALAIPGAYYLFLPVPASLAAVSFCLFLHLGVDLYKRGKGDAVLAGKIKPISDLVYNTLLSVLAVLNGATIIMNLGK